MVLKGVVFADRVPFVLFVVQVERMKEVLERVQGAMDAKAADAKKQTDEFER